MRPRSASADASSDSSRSVTFLGALLVGTLAVRPQLTAVGPLLPDIQRDLGVSHTAAGALAALPLFCMGVFAMPAARFLRRVSARAVIGWCLATIAVGSMLRAAAPGYALVLLLTLPFGIAAGVLGALLPAVVKSGLAARPALGTGTFALGINGGAALGAALAAPLAQAMGGWRWSLALLAAAGALTVPVWLRLSRRSASGAQPSASARVSLPWRSGLAWGASCLFTFQALCFFGLNAWLADAMLERGWPDGRAGALVGLLNVVTIPGVVLVALGADRAGGVHRPLVAAALTLVVGTVGLAQTEGSAWIWVALVGLSLGALFALAMTLPAIIARRPEDAAAAAGLQLGLGYSAAALAPLVLGSLRDSTGSFAVGLWLVVLFAALVTAAVLAVLILLDRSVRPTGDAATGRHGHRLGERDRRR